jgi:hypothetical protein
MTGLTPVPLIVAGRKINDWRTKNPQLILQWNSKADDCVLPRNLLNLRARRKCNNRQCVFGAKGRLRRTITVRRLFVLFVATVLSLNALLPPKDWKRTVLKKTTFQAHPWRCV